MRPLSLKIYLIIVVVLASKANALGPSAPVQFGLQYQQASSWFQEDAPSQLQSPAETQAQKSRDDAAESPFSKLRRNGISAIPAEQQDDTEEDVLQELIDQLGALQLPDTKTVNQQESSEEPLPEETVDAGPVDSSRTQKPSKPEPSPLELIVAALEENPQSIVDPFGVAEALYGAGNFSDAAKFYQLSLDRMSNKEDHPDRDWAMLQKANCIRAKQPDNAGIIYEKLSQQYPNSTWNSAATAHRQVISWYKENDPQAILAEYVIENESESISEPNSL